MLPHLVPASNAPAASHAAPVSRAPDATQASFLVSLLTVVGIVLFVDVEILAVAAAAVWSIAGLMHLPLEAVVVLAALIGAPALWACWIVARKAWRAEMVGIPDEIDA